MSRSQNSFIKHQKAEKKRKKRQEKIQKKIDKKDQETDTMDDMIAYVDEFGNITNEPPEPQNQKESSNKNEKKS